MGSLTPLQGIKQPSPAKPPKRTNNCPLSRTPTPTPTWMRPHRGVILFCFPPEYCVNCRGCALCIRPKTQEIVGGEVLALGALAYLDPHTNGAACSGWPQRGNGGEVWRCKVLAVQPPFQVKAAPLWNIYEMCSLAVTHEELYKIGKEVNLEGIREILQSLVDKLKNEEVCFGSTAVSGAMCFGSFS